MTDSSRQDGRFATTRWTVVRRSADSDPEIAMLALEDLCAGYWYPLYAWLRRSGRTREDSGDLVQSFFLTLLGRDDLQRVTPAGGRFRSWLLTALKHVVADEDAARRTLKRGGGRTIMPLELERAEERYAVEPTDDRWTPDRIFDRRWALTLLERALERIRVEEERRGRGDLFAALEPALGGAPTRPYADIAEDLDTTTPAVKAAAHRLRGRFRSVVREEIGATVESEDEASSELDDLMNALG